MSMNYEQWRKDLKEFDAVEEHRVPPGLSERIQRPIHADLNPSPAGTFLKLASLVAVTGTVSLLVCPQFGLSFTHNRLGLMHYFMTLGPYLCMVACGSVFLGSGALLASIVLTPAEVKLIRRNRVLYFPALAAAALGSFICAGAEMLAFMAGYWFVGSALGAIAVFELGNRARLAARLKQRSSALS